MRSIVVAVMAIAVVAVPGSVSANGISPPGGPDPCYLEVAPGGFSPHPHGAVEPRAATTERLAEGHGILRNAGDLSGDGLEDAYERLELYAPDDGSSRVVVTALNGATGRELWSREGAGWIELIPSGDLDGARGSDLLSVEMSVQDAPGAYRATLVLSGVRGTDGTSMWSRRFEGTSTGFAVGPTGGDIHTGASVPVAVIVDANGDGARDVLVERRDGAWLSDGGTQTYRGIDAVVYEIVSGRTGAPLTLITPGKPTAQVQAMPAGDLSGDDLEDVVVVSFTYGEDGRSAGPATVTAYPGRGGPPLWETEIAASDYPHARGYRLRRGARSDVVVVSSEVDRATGELRGTRLQALAGEDGAVLWTSRFAASADVTAAGDATKDGGTELLVTTARYDGRSESPREAVALVDGASGRRLWSRSAVAPRVVGDATRDGVVDILETRRTGSGAKARRFAEFSSGADGRRVWTRELAAREAMSGLYADLTGDRRADLVVCTARGDRIAYGAADGATGRDLWRRRVTAPGGAIFLDTAAIRRGGADILESANAHGERREIVTAARSGRDGGALWKRSLPLSPGPRPLR